MLFRNPKSEIEKHKVFGFFSFGFRYSVFGFSPPSLLHTHAIKPLWSEGGGIGNGLCCPVARNGLEGLPEGIVKEILVLNDVISSGHGVEREKERVCREAGS